MYVGIEEATKIHTHTLEKCVDKLQWFQVCVFICGCVSDKNQDTEEKKENDHKKINLKGIRSHYQNVFTVHTKSLFFISTSSSSSDSKQRYKKEKQRNKNKTVEEIGDVFFKDLKE